MGFLANLYKDIPLGRIPHGGLINSKLSSTRIWWRRELGLPELVVNDPRHTAIIAASRSEGP